MFSKLLFKIIEVFYKKIKNTVISIFNVYFIVLFAISL